MHFLISDISYSSKTGYLGNLVTFRISGVNILAKYGILEFILFRIVLAAYSSLSLAL